MTRSRSLVISVVLCAVAIVTAGAAACSGSSDGASSTTQSTTVPETTTTTEPPLEAGRQVFVYTPAAGHCFDRRRLEERPTTGPQQTDIVLVLDCSLPHDNEVFDVLDMPGDVRDYPGEIALTAHARRNCTLRFEDYVGRSYEVSAFEVGYYLPSSTEWEAGAHRLGCYLYAVNGEKLVGSMSGSAR